MSQLLGGGLLLPVPGATVRASVQELDGLARGQRGQFGGCGDAKRVEELGSRCQQDVPGIGPGQERPEYLRDGIVEDEQPRRVGRLFQPPCDGVDRLVQVGLIIGEAEPIGSDSVLALEFEFVVRPEPEDRLVSVAISVGILDGRLRLPNPSQAADGLDEGGASPAGELAAEAVENRLAAGEEVHLGVGIRDLELVTRHTWPRLS